jgi:RND family efflux transporter MFP subunit
MAQSSEPLRFAGIVQARRRATLTFQVSGKLSERPVELGETVAAGQVLARLFNPGLEPGRDSAAARLQELKTRYDQAGREWQRSQSLYEKGVVSEQTLEQLEAQRDSLSASVATARAELAESQQMVAESVLKAPFAGRVASMFTEVDEFVAAGEPVMRLSAPSDYEVEVRVPTYLLSQVSVGQSVPVWNVKDRRLAKVSGEIVELAQPGAERGELQLVLVRLPQGSLEAGVPVEVGITPKTTSATTVPMLSVVRSSSGTSVFRVTDAQAQRVSVDVHRIVGERAVVTSDQLQPDDQVVYAGMTRITDGDPLEILP